MKIKQQIMIEMEMLNDETIEDAEARLDQELSDALRGTELNFRYGDSYPEVG